MQNTTDNWLQDKLEYGVRNHWCARSWCTTCGSPDMKALLLGIPKRSGMHSVPYETLQKERALEIIHQLNLLSPPFSVSAYELEEFTQWLFLKIWQRFGDEAHQDIFSQLQPGWALDVLDRMRRHYADRQRARAIHDARQGIKKKDWPV